MQKLSLWATLPLVWTTLSKFFSSQDKVMTKHRAEEEIEMIVGSGREVWGHTTPGISKKRSTRRLCRKVALSPLCLQVSGRYDSPNASQKSFFPTKHTQTYIIPKIKAPCRSGLNLGLEKKSHAHFIYKTKWAFQLALLGCKPEKGDQVKTLPERPGAVRRQYHFVPPLLLAVSGRPQASFPASLLQAWVRASGPPWDPSSSHCKGAATLLDTWPHGW